LWFCLEREIEGVLLSAFAEDHHAKSPRYAGALSPPRPSIHLRECGVVLHVQSPRMYAEQRVAPAFRSSSSAREANRGPGIVAGESARQLEPIVLTSVR